MGMVVDADGNAYVTGYSVGVNSSTSGYLTAAFSPQGLLLWTNRYDETTNGEDEAQAIAMDNQGNLYVTGRSSSTNWGMDYATLKYSKSGIPLWTNRYNGPYWDEAVAVAVDGNGNAYVTGNSSDIGGDSRFVTVKCAGSGYPSWGQNYGKGYGLAIKLDSSDNVFVAGFGINAGFSTDFAVVSFYSNGGLKWIQTYDGPGHGSDEAHALAIDSSGNVIVTGPSTGLNGNFDIATIKYSGAGLPLWTNRYNGPANGADTSTAIAVDANGNSVVAGSAAGVGTGDDLIVLKYSGAGLPLWTNRYNGPGNGQDAAVAVALDPVGNVFVTGYSLGTNGFRNFVTIAYSANGSGLWTNRYDGPIAGRDQASALALDKQGNVYVTGQAAGGSTGSDLVIIKYSSLLPSPIPLQAQTVGNAVVLKWADARFQLQVATSAAGTYTDVPGAANPYTNSVASNQLFFRLKAN